MSKRHLIAAIGAGIIVVLFSVLSTLWYQFSDQAESFFTTFIAPVIDTEKYPLSLTIIAVIIVIVIAMVILNHIKSELEGENSDLQRTLDSEIQTVIRANRELNNYRSQDNLKVVFRKFISRNRYVHAIQSYRFEEKNYRWQTFFTLNFLVGAVYDGVSINAIHQMVFPIKRKDLNNFRKALKEFEEEGSILSLSSYSLTAFQRLQKKKKVTDVETGLFMLMDLALETLEAGTGFDLTPPFTEAQKTRLEELRNSRRTGLIRAGILREGFYSFTHEGSRDKANRQYLATLAIVEGEPHIFSIAMDSSILEEDYDEALNSVKEEFTALLNEL